MKILVFAKSSDDRIDKHEFETDNWRFEGSWFHICKEDGEIIQTFSSETVWTIKFIHPKS